MLPGYKDPYSGRVLTRGEIGCFLSHHFTWKQVYTLRAVAKHHEVLGTFFTGWSSLPYSTIVLYCILVASLCVLTTRICLNNSFSFFNLHGILFDHFKCNKGFHAVFKITQLIKENQWYKMLNITFVSVV